MPEFNRRRVVTGLQFAQKRFKSFVETKVKATTFSGRLTKEVGLLEAKAAAALERATQDAADRVRG